MNSNSPPANLLVIARDSAVIRGLHAVFVESYAQVLAANSIQSACACLERETVSVILCESGIMEETHSIASFTRAATEKAITLVLHNPQQGAGVRFQRISNQSFYCLQTSCCRDLLPLIAAPAKLLNHPGRSSIQPSRPCFILPLEAPSAVIHSMY